MKTNQRLVRAALLCMATLIALLTGCGGSTSSPISVTSDYSAEYMSGKYYQALKNVTLTGNQRVDIIAIAESQIGYCEGNEENQLDGLYQGNGDYTEYGRFMGSNGTAWCSEFASWCIRQAQVPTSIIQSSKGASIKKFAAPYYTWNETIYADGDYEPRAGDLALFAWNGTSTSAEYLSHTAIVHSVEKVGDQVYLTVIHGNSKNKVRKSKYTIDASNGDTGNGSLVYFVAPNYMGG